MNISIAALFFCNLYGITNCTLQFCCCALQKYSYLYDAQHTRNCAWQSIKNFAEMQQPSSVSRIKQEILQLQLSNNLKFTWRLIQWMKLFTWKWNSLRNTNFLNIVGKLIGMWYDTIAIKLFLWFIHYSPCDHNWDLNYKWISILTLFSLLKSVLTLGRLL